MFEPDPHESLAEFLERHARAQELATDDYERPPFAADIREGKNDAIYNAHSYHTKVPPRSIIPYILHYTQPGDLVLDPFCGSGMTGVAAQMCANPPPDILESFPELKDRVGPRACILNDLSPAACHIAHNYTTPVDVEALKREFARIKAAVKDEFDWLYGTEHYEPAMGLYDPQSADVSARLKNSLEPTMTKRLIEGGPARTWELVDRAEVERRLGYAVTALPRSRHWESMDHATVDKWVVIPARIQYTVWSDVYRCEGFVTVEEPTGKISTRGKNTGRPMVHKRRVSRGCGAEIVLWDVAVDRTTGDVVEVFKCSQCETSWKKVQLTRIRTIPVAVYYEFAGASSASVTRKVPLRPERVHRRVTESEERLLNAPGLRDFPYWSPTTLIDSSGPQYSRNALAGRSVRNQADFYTPRNFRAMALMWHEIGKTDNLRIRSALRFVWTSIYNRSSRRTKWHRSRLGQAALSGQLYIPSLQVENNILALLETKLVQIVRGVSLLGQTRAASYVSCGPAGQLREIPDNSVDYIFCDPPFGSNIYYSEVNLIWEAWLGEVTEATDEAVVHRKNDGGTKRLPDYARLMQEAFKEIFRVLKPGRWSTVEFNNNDGAVFEAIKQAVRQAGFEIVNMLLLDKQQKTFKQVKGAEGVEDVVDKDVLFNLHKPAIVQIETLGEDHDVEQQIADVVRQHLQTLPERIKTEPSKYSDEHRTTATMNSMLMNALIPRGVSVERLNLPFIERVCGRYFRKVRQHWYLRGEAVGGNGGDQLFAEAIAITDELTAIEWLRHELQARPTLLGELKPLWMRATGLLSAELSQSLVLEDLLTENFWRDAGSNRWREPTSEERERMNDDRSLRVLHDADRFVNSAFRRSTTDEERCEWIDTLFQACRAIEDNEAEALPALRGFDKAGAYSLIPRLFQSVLRDHVSVDAYGRAEKQARAASQRVARQVEAHSGNAQAAPDIKQSPLDFEK